MSGPCYLMHADSECCRNAQKKGTLTWQQTPWNVAAVARLVALTPQYTVTSEQVLVVITSAHVVACRAHKMQLKRLAL